MRLFHTAFLITLLCCTSTFGQVHHQSSKRTKEDKIECRKFKNNFFRSIGWSGLIGDAGWSPKYEKIEGSPTDRKSLNSRDYVNIVSFTYEFRYNLINIKDKCSFSLAAPLSVGTGPPLLTFQAPIFFDFNFGNHSTFNNINSFGFLLGVGRMYTNNGILSSENKHSWSVWVARFGLKFTKGGKERFLLFRVGTAKRNEVPESRAQPGAPLVFKFTFGKSLNY